MKTFRVFFGGSTVDVKAKAAAWYGGSSVPVAASEGLRLMIGTKVAANFAPGHVSGYVVLEDGE